MKKSTGYYWMVMYETGPSEKFYDIDTVEELKDKIDENRELLTILKIYPPEEDK